MNNLKWQAWFDGSALPNPGKLGIGVSLLSPDGLSFELSQKLASEGCNNEAELHALCAALQLAHASGAKHLLLSGDSDVAIQYVLKTKVTSVERITALVTQAQSLISKFEQVELTWVPRHRNTAADQLSRQALGLAEKPLKPKKSKRRRR